MKIENSIRAFFGRHPKLKYFSKCLVSPLRRTTSSNYNKINPNDIELVAKNLQNAWKDTGIPEIQLQEVEKTLELFRSGFSVPSFDVLIKLLESITNPTDSSSLLEVGCSSGYYSEAFQIKMLPVAYVGCDYSPAFIALAKKCYPNASFYVADATDLHWPDSTFDIVVSGCCLLHIIEFEKAIQESVRISKRYVIFHRTPVSHTNATTYYTKRAYGIETIEIRFNEEEFIHILRLNGLRALEVVTLNVTWSEGDALATKTYLCEKV